MKGQKCGVYSVGLAWLGRPQNTIIWLSYSVAESSGRQLTPSSFCIAPCTSPCTCDTTRTSRLGGRQPSHHFLSGLSYFCREWYLILLSALTHSCYLHTEKTFATALKYKRHTLENCWNRNFSGLEAWFAWPENHIFPTSITVILGRLTIFCLELKEIARKRKLKIFEKI